MVGDLVAALLQGAKWRHCGGPCIWDYVNLLEGLGSGEKDDKSRRLER